VIVFSCPRCQHRYTVHDCQAGEKFACAECAQRVQVPSPQKTVAPANRTVLAVDLWPPTPVVKRPRIPAVKDQPPPGRRKDEWPVAWPAPPSRRWPWVVAGFLGAVAFFVISGGLAAVMFLDWPTAPTETTVEAPRTSTGKEEFQKGNNAPQKKSENPTPKDLSTSKNVDPKPKKEPDKNTGIQEPKERQSRQITIEATDKEVTTDLKVQKDEWIEFQIKGKWRMWDRWDYTGALGHTNFKKINSLGCLGVLVIKIGDSVEWHLAKAQVQRRLWVSNLWPHLR
jgi:hypothetical protein